ncbi:MAG: AtpZ/AtpI family protein [Acidimicrobiaceae bacterium]|nr:AtpZ/AtpI family protein [Acidimicrobiaceae bacterium]
MAPGAVGGDGSEDGLVKALEIAGTLGLFVVAGFGLDYWWGTGPWLALSFGLTAFIVKLVVEWYRYVERMQAHEQEMASSRPSESRGIDRAAGLDEPASLPTGVSLEVDADSTA